MWEVIITVHQCECRANKKKNAKHRFEKKNFKLINNSIYGKIMRNVKKEQIWNSWPSKIELFDVTTKLSYNKMHFRKFVNNRNEKKKTNKISHK